MSKSPRVRTTTLPASHVLGGKLDSIPFSSFHLSVILVLGFAALVDGYDGSMTGTLLVLAKKPLHISESEPSGCLISGAGINASDTNYQSSPKILRKRSADRTVGAG